MSYEPTYTRPYEGGYKNRPSEETPEMAEFINKRDDTLLKIEAFLKDLDLSGLGSEYALLSEAGYSLDVSMDDYYVLTISLKNKAGNVLSSKNVDLPIESMIIDVDYADGFITFTLQNGNTLDVSIIDIVSGLVPTTRTIAGLDLEDDITVAELKSALGISSGGSSDAGTLDVTDKITPNPDITFTDLKYEAIQIGNAVFLTFTIQREGGTVGTAYDVFSIDESILPNETHSNIVYGAGAATNAVVKATNAGVVTFNGGGWGQGSIQWFTDASTTEIDKTTGGELKPWLYDTSGEEVLVGVYNGKPLYRKCVYIDALPSTVTSGNYAHGIENIDTIYNYGGVVLWKETGVVSNLNAAQITNKVLNTEASFYCTVDHTKIVIYVGLDRSNCAAYVTIEYTKTTDAEGSGNSLTPYGIFNAKLDGIEEDIDAILADLEIKLITTTYTDIKSEGKYYLGLDCTDKPSSNACFVLALEHPTISGYLGLFALDVITNTLYTNTYQSTSGWSGWDDKASLSYVRLINGTNSGIGTDVVDWFENNAPEGISVKKISNPINAYITTESWFTFYKISKYGRIEQRPINSDKLFVKPYSNGNWLEWDEYVKKSEVAALMVVSSIDVTPDSLIESITFRRRGNVGQIVFGKLISEVEIGATVNIGTIPEGYIPMASQMGVIPVTVGTSHCSMYVGVNSSGTLSVRFMQDIPVNTQLYGLFTYMI